MKNIFFILIVSCSLMNQFILSEELNDFNSYSKLLELVRTDIIDKALLALPKRAQSDILKMSIEINKIKEKNLLSDAESAFLVYKWITKNIIYDCNGDEKSEYASNVFNTGMGISSGIADLFKTMVNLLHIEANSIKGIVKYQKNDINNLIQETDFVWNYIIINGTYYLVDVSMGSGTCNINTFQKTFSDFYFGTNPEFFIYSHFPEDSKWQLLSNNITYSQFSSLASLIDSFFKYGFKTINPNTNIFIGDARAYIGLTYDESLIPPNLKVGGITIDGNMEMLDLLSYTKSKGKIEISFLMNKQKLRYLIVSVEKSPNNYIGIALYKVNNSVSKNN